jgi:ATP-dependent DNA ligase
MSFIEPMYAAPMPKKTPLNIRPGLYAVEEKFDGHRLIVQMEKEGFHMAWSRNGLTRELPPHLLTALHQLPEGIYDGELLVPGKRSYGVTEIVNGPDLVYTIFDVVHLMGVSIAHNTYDERRAYLAEMPWTILAPAVKLAPSLYINTEDEMLALLRNVWARDGEGLIIKRRMGRYHSGKRPKEEWIKVKALRSAVMTVVGFVQSKGEIVNRGPYAVVVLRDEEGHETTVKTVNDMELQRFEAEAPVGDFMVAQHPAIGRKLRIEYQERTPDGLYRHPRWDRWEDA